MSIQTRLTPYSNLLTMALGMVMFLLFTYCIFTYSEDSSGLTLLSLLMLIQITPAIFTFSRRRFNFISFVMLNHFIVYSVAKYNLITNLQKTNVLTKGAQAAIVEMIFCSLLIIGAYFLTRIVAIRKHLSPEQFQMLTLTRRQYFWAGFYAFSQPFIYTYFPPSLYVLHLLSSYGAVVLVFCSRTDNPAFDRWVKFTILLASIYAFLTYSTLSMLGSLGWLFFVVSFIQWRWSNFFLLITILIAGVTIQTVKADYRIINLENDIPLSTPQRVALLTNLMWMKFGSDKSTPSLLNQNQELDEQGNEEEDRPPEEEIGGSLAKGFARIGDDSLERVLLMTPSQVPFWNGESYLHLPYIFIPRVLWPNKPERDLWNKFGRVYHYLSSDDFATSVGVNFLGEAYMNFGFTGLYSVAMLFGMMIALMESACYHFLPQQCFFAFICFMLPFMNYGIDLCSVINSVVLILSLMYAIRYRLVRMITRDAYC